MSWSPSHRWVHEGYGLIDVTRIKRRHNWRFQYRITGDFQHVHTSEIQYDVEGYSFAKYDRDQAVMYDEAYSNAQSRCGGTNWVLIKRKRNRNAATGRFEPDWIRWRRVKR